MSEKLSMDALEAVSGGKIYNDAIGKVEITDCKHGVYAKQEPDGNSANVAFVHLGERFKYYMVFEKSDMQIQGSYTMDRFIEILRNL